MDYLKLFENDPKPIQGKYRNVQFVLWYFIIHDGPKHDFSAMQHWNAYIKIPYKHPWRRYMHPKWHEWKFFSTRAKEKRIMTDKIPYLNVHGGITFAHYVKAKDRFRWPQTFSKGPWIGWDYAHAGDQMWHLPTLKWQQPEIYKIEMGLKRDLEKSGGIGAYERMHKEWKPEQVLADVYDAVDELLRIKH